MTKKILYIIDSLSAGAGRVVYNLVNSLKDYETVIVVIYPGGEMIESFKNIKIINLNKKPGIGINTIKQLRKIIEKEKPDIVHTHNVDAYEYGIIAAKLAGVKKIIHTAHGKSIKRGLLKKLRENGYHKFVSLFLDKYIVVSKDLKKYVIQNWCLNENKVKVIYNGVNIEKFKKKTCSRKIKQELNLNKDSKVIGIVAGLRKVKNHKCLFQAISIVKKEFSEIKLIVVGDGKEKEKLLNLSKKLNLTKNIIFLGNRTDVANLYNCFNINILFSFSECNSMTLLEAMASETLCIATNVGGNKELINNNLTGMLTKSNNELELAEKIITILKNPEVSKILTKNARKTIEKRFTISNMIENYTTVYLD